MEKPETDPQTASGRLAEFVNEAARRFCEREMSKPSRYEELAMVFEAIASVYRDLDARTKPVPFGSE